MVKFAADQGWTLRRIRIDDGCYEVTGRGGRPRDEVKLDPATLSVVEMEFEDDDDHKNRNQTARGREGRLTRPTADHAADPRRPDMKHALLIGTALGTSPPPLPERTARLPTASYSQNGCCADPDRLG